MKFLFSLFDDANVNIIPHIIYRFWSYSLVDFRKLVDNMRHHVLYSLSSSTKNFQNYNLHFLSDKAQFSFCIKISAFDIWLTENGRYAILSFILSSCLKKNPYMWLTYTELNSKYDELKRLNILNTHNRIIFYCNFL